jgi:ABC-type Zn uptake system ZnuABC Zn-binding protein ZnuA
MMNDATLTLLKELNEQIAAAEHPVELLVIMKSGADYHRYSTGIDDLRALVGALEIAKYDALRRMTQ